MLIHVNVTERNHSEKMTGDMILNTAFCASVVDDGGVARVTYCTNPENRRGGQDVLTLAETVATIRTAMNLDYAVTALVLNVYPQKDLTEDTIPTTFIISEVVLAYPYGSDYSTADGTGFKTVVIINEKGNLKEYIVDNHYLDLISYAETASTSTYTTS